MSLKDNLLTISKLQTTYIYHKNSTCYKPLNMAALRKTLCKVRTLLFQNKACNHICMLLGLKPQLQRQLDLSSNS